MVTRELPQGELNAKASVREPDLARNRGLFDRFNRLRFQNVYHVFPENYQLMFKIVPFLLHTNFRGFPGYVENFETPCGINNYIPDDDTANLIDRYFSKKVKIASKDARTDAFIEFLSVMGSVGSVAQTKRSDFDIWVGIHRDAVEDEPYRAFLKKLRDVEEWLVTMRLEVHFFPTDIKSVTRNVFGAVDDESCGSAQALMLKDEFYRTAILMAGKVPYWWMVDPDVTETEYAGIHKQWTDSDQTFSGQYIDIGNIQKIDKSEFFGAALWQLVKSLKYPFKSFIKMCLIEKYLFSDNSDRVSLLSNTLKENVLRNENLDPDSIDAYLLMFSAVEQYFLAHDRQPDAELLRTCFYMKVQPNLSGLNKFVHAGSDKQLMMDKYVKSWGWDQPKIKRLDTFHLWSVDDILKLDHELKVYMVRTFSALTKTRDMIENNSLISENDLTVISRKLMSYYMPKPKKVKNFCFSFDDSVYEPELNISRQDSGWKLYRGEARREKTGMTFSNLLYSADHLSDLALWISHSKIFNPFHTKLTVYAGEANVSFNHLSKLIHDMADTLGHSPSKSNYFLEEPFIQKVFITCGLDESDPTDRISVFYVNSWNEMFAEHFSSEREITPLLCGIIAGYIRAGRPNPLQFLTFHSTSGGLKDTLALKGKLTDILSAFRSVQPAAAASIFVDSGEEGYFCFAADGGEVKYFKQANIYALLETLRREIRGDLPRSYTFSQAADPSGFLSAAAKSLKKGEVDVFTTRVNASFSLILFSDEFNRLQAELVPAPKLAGELYSIRSFAFASDPARGINFYEISELAGKGGKPEYAARPVKSEVMDAAADGTALAVKAIQKNEIQDIATAGPADFTYETNLGLFDPSDPAQNLRLTAAVRQSGGAEITHVVLNKNSSVSMPLLLGLKISLQKSLNALIHA